MQLPDIRPDHIDLVRQILQQHVPRAGAWVFGSRAKWTARDTSDLDLCISAPSASGTSTPAAISFEQMGALREAFENSNLPYKVDVVDWATTSEAFRTIIDQSKVPLPLAGDETVKAAGPAVGGRGGVMGEWEYSTIKEMCELVIDCPHFTPEWTDDGSIVVRNQNIRNGRLDLTNPSFTNRNDFDRRIRRAKPKLGDIIITREAPMGEVCLVPDGIELCLGQRQVLLRPKLDVDSKYLHIALRSPEVRHQIMWSEGTGSTVSNIRIPVLEAIKIPRFGKAEPAIAAVLSALDDKIELNRRMNETLEASARALFRDWFVDFGPVKAKAAAHAALGGTARNDGAKAANAPAPTLAPEIWSLFPAALDDEGKPEGWEIVQLGECLTRLKLGSLYDQKSASPYGKVPILDQGKSGIIGYHNDEPNIKAAADRRVSTFANHTCVQRLLDFDFSTIQNVIPFIGKDLPTEWVHFASLDKQKFEEYRGHWPSFVVQEIVKPSLELALLFKNIVHPILERISLNNTESRTLAQTRDMLLPKLMSGEIRVADGVRAVDDAL